MSVSLIAEHDRNRTIHMYVLLPLPLNLTDCKCPDGVASNSTLQLASLYPWRGALHLHSSAIIASSVYMVARSYQPFPPPTVPQPRLIYRKKSPLFRSTLARCPAYLVVWKTSRLHGAVCPTYYLPASLRLSILRE